MSNQWGTAGSPRIRDSAQPSIMIVADHKKVRGALSGWLNATFPECHVQEALSGEEALIKTRSQPADVALIVRHLPRMNGIEATRRLKALSPRTRVVLVSFFEEPCYRVDAESAGASAFVSMRALSKELAPIITRFLAKPSAVRAKNELALKLR